MSDDNLKFKKNIKEFISFKELTNNHMFNNKSA